MSNTDKYVCQLLLRMNQMQLEITNSIIHTEYRNQIIISLRMINRRTHYTQLCSRTESMYLLETGLNRWRQFLKCTKIFLLDLVQIQIHPGTTE